MLFSRKRMVWHHCDYSRYRFDIDDFGDFWMCTGPDCTLRSLQKSFMWWTIARNACKCQILGSNCDPKIKVNFSNFKCISRNLQGLQTIVVNDISESHLYISRHAELSFDCSTHKDRAICPVGKRSRAHLITENGDWREIPQQFGIAWR